jgi:hypothetical protein
MASRVQTPMATLIGVSQPLPRSSWITPASLRDSPGGPPAAGLAIVPLTAGLLPQPYVPEPHSNLRTAPPDDHTASDEPHWNCETR